MKIKTSSICIVTFEIVLFSILSVLLYKMFILNQSLYVESQNKSKMVKVADKLRQSSDDLTHFARAYAVTNNKLYYKQYFNTLDIRNGKLARPLMYDSIYWDLEKSIRDARHPKTQKLSLKQMIKELPFSIQEIDKLHLSEANSNDLGNLEIKAFDAMAQTPPNQELAIELLYSKEYYNAKHKIMNPIDEFMIMLDKRTQNNLRAARDDINQNFVMFLIASFIFIIGNFIIFKLIKKILHDMIDDEVEKNKIKEQELVAQSHYAAMGEMISMIAHQWRQPISAISMDANNILADIELDMLEEKTLKSGVKNVVARTQELSKTIDDFRNFFRPEQIPQEIIPEDVFRDAFSVMEKSLENNKIKIVLETKNTTKITTYSRELMRVIINILRNSNEVLVKNSIMEKEIFVSIIDAEDEIVVRICDNVGGISEEIIDKIFDPYFTTKDKNVGTGLGLYISKTIVEKHLNGTLKVYNKDDGACFEIRLPYMIQ